MHPVIGISAARETSQWGVWDEEADVLPASYSQSVERAGGAPVLLPPSVPRVAASVVRRLDGLVIAGGPDVQPMRSGERPHERTMGWREDRDAWELALLDEAARINLPVLGICRGMQLMAVHAGGVLEQHVPDRVGSQQHSPGGNSYGDIAVDIVVASRLARAIGARGAVRCHHHQAVSAHPGFEPVAWAADGTLEAMEDPQHPFRLAVQWHPETQEDAGLFRALVAAAAAAP